MSEVAVGDHIASINGTDLTGCRHFEVARMLKEIPIGSEFSLTVVEPKKAFGASLSLSLGFPFSTERLCVFGVHAFVSFAPSLYPSFLASFSSFPPSFLPCFFFFARSPCLQVWLIAIPTPPPFAALSTPLDEVAGMKPRGAQGGTGDVKAGGGKKTLRMKRDGNAVVEDVVRLPCSVCACVCCACVFCLHAFRFVHMLLLVCQSVTFQQWVVVVVLGDDFCY